MNYRFFIYATMLAGAATLCSCRSEKKETVLGPNPFITHMYTADPSAHVWDDGRLYIYASHDVDPPRGCDLMDRYHVFSTDDMVNWTDHGEILSSEQVAWGRPEGGFMWAPDCAYKDGTYYFYFPHPSGSDWNQTWKVGVATSKYPDREFTPMDKPMEGVGGFALIDPAVFVDDDGKAYFYYGGGGKCYGAPLKDNMVELADSLQEMTGLEDFHEASWVHKYNGKYYLSYADNHVEDGRGANRLCLGIQRRVSRTYRLRHQPRLYREIQRRVVCILPQSGSVGTGQSALHLRRQAGIQPRRHYKSSSADKRKQR